MGDFDREFIELSNAIKNAGNGLRISILRVKDEKTYSNHHIWRQLTTQVYVTYVQYHHPTNLLGSVFGMRYRAAPYTLRVWVYKQAKNNMYAK